MYYCAFFSQDDPVMINSNSLIAQSNWKGDKSFILKDNLYLSSETQGQIMGVRELSKQAEKYGTKKSKQRQEKPLGTMSYQTCSKRSPPFCLLIGQKNTKVFWHQLEVRMAVTVWNWSGKTLFPGALLAVLYFSSCHIFPLV